MIIIHEAGRIRQVMTTYPENYASSLEESGWSWVKLPQLGEDVFGRWYIEDGRMVERRPSGIEATYSMKVGEVISFPDLPASVVRFEDQRIEAAPGEFEFSADAPGVYELNIECWPMLDVVTEITVT